MISKLFSEKKFGWKKLSCEKFIQSRLGWQIEVSLARNLISFTQDFSFVQWLSTENEFSDCCTIKTFNVTAGITTVA
jgi:hypothetical protein